MFIKVRPNFGYFSSLNSIFMHLVSKDGVVVKALAYHQCSLGSNCVIGRLKWEEFVVGSCLAKRVFLRFSFNPKTNISDSNLIRCAFLIRKPCILKLFLLITHTSFLTLLVSCLIQVTFFTEDTDTEKESDSPEGTQKMFWFDFTFYTINFSAFLCLLK